VAPFTPRPSERRILFWMRYVNAESALGIPIMLDVPLMVISGGIGILFILVVFFFPGGCWAPCARSRPGVAEGPPRRGERPVVTGF
jgi:hypothetical protein